MPSGLQVFDASGKLVMDTTKRISRLLYEIDSPATRSFSAPVSVSLAGLTANLGNGEMWYYVYSKRATAADATAMSSLYVEKGAGDNVLLYNVKALQGQKWYEGDLIPDYPFRIMIGVR